MDRTDLAPSDLPAGPFSAWLRETRSALAQGTDACVPCGRCNACCRSSYFVHIGPDETHTLARIPRELQFPAPGLPAGTVLLGYDEAGRCPMLHKDKCSIYQHRPRTCRIYDCRVFTATGITPDRPSIAEQAKRWAFSFPIDQDFDESLMVHKAAVFLREHPECAHAGERQSSPAQTAALAVEVRDVFRDVDSEPASVAEHCKAVAEAVQKLRQCGR